MIINVIIISILEIETWNRQKSSVHIQIFDFRFHFLVRFYQSKNRLLWKSSSQEISSSAIPPAAWMN